MGKPQCGWWEASRGAVSGCRHPVKAAQGQRGRFAWGLDARVERQRGRASMAGEAPVGVASKGKGVLSPWEIPQASALIADRHPGQSGRAAVPSGARAGMAGRPRASVEEEKGVWGKG
jgi:hypothetical protein